jgi:hypothetical protein
MKRSLPILVLLLNCFLAAPLFAQSGESETPLGDIARALRKTKKPPEEAVIDNDNLSKVVDDAESRRVKGSVKFSFEGSGKDVQASSPEVTCSLSFNGDSPPSADASSPLDLPSSELVKLDGPASISGDTLQISVYNPTAWKIDEITVGLTILRPASGSAANFGSARLLPTAAGDDSPSQKRSDMTVLYHLKGSASPFSSAVFKQSIGIILNPDQEWHWAIVQARGTPPK